MLTSLNARMSVAEQQNEITWDVVWSAVWSVVWIAVWSAFLGAERLLERKNMFGRKRLLSRKRVLERKRLSGDSIPPDRKINVRKVASRHPAPVALQIKSWFTL